MRKALFGVLLLVLVAVSFFNGFASARYKIFPYNVLRFLYREKLDLSYRASPEKRGRWEVARNGGGEGGPSGDRRKAISKIGALPYLQGYYPAPKESNVTRYDEESAYNGLNLYTSGHAPQAILMDMRGNVLHEWGMEFEDVWPELIELIEDDPHTRYWRRAHLYDNGDILAIFDWIGLIKLDKDSRLLWSYQGGCHHDLSVAGNGDIYVLSRREISPPRGSASGDLSTMI